MCLFCTINDIREVHNAAMNNRTEDAGEAPAHPTDPFISSTIVSGFCGMCTRIERVLVLIVTPPIFPAQRLADVHPLPSMRRPCQERIESTRCAQSLPRRQRRLEPCSERMIRNGAARLDAATLLHEC